MTRDAREQVMAKRHLIRGKELSEHTRVQGPLSVGDVVQIQNQQGPHKNKWDLFGSVVEVLGHNSYLVRTDRSGRTSKRNM